MTSPDITLTSLDIDSGFIKQAKSMGLQTLGDIMRTGLPELQKKKGFNYIWYADMLKLLQSRGLLEEFERRQL